MKRIFTFLCLALALNLSRANNVGITGISVPDANHLTFTISWDNSWYIPGTNWDAVWIFVKAQNCAGSTTWDHVKLSPTPANYSVSGSAVLYCDPAVTDSNGVFVRPNSSFSGSESGTITVQFASSIPTFATTNFNVFGIEMVWVPQGDFTVGDNSTSYTQSHYSFGSAAGGPSTPIPYPISSESVIAASAFFHNDSSSYGIWTFGPDFYATINPIVPASFPKGYNGFYCEKYEISQEQYVAFLNDLTLAQQGSRTFAPPTSAAGTLAMTSTGNQNRNSIVIQTPSTAGKPAVYVNDLFLNSTGDGGDIACNYLSWGDLEAYLGWAALRPMTELEFEKACRGSNGSVLTEFAWGNTSIVQAISSAISNGGLSSEVSTSSGNGLSAYGAGSSTTLGPLRVGFTATATTVRTSAGASYWGIMDLSGNLWEQTEQTGWGFGNNPPGGLIFTGNPGTGTLDGFGNYTADATWGTVIYSIVRGGVIGNIHFKIARYQTELTYLPVLKIRAGSGVPAEEV
jgi:formylglycine-generating enzyme required for sulfatase activity